MRQKKPSQRVQSNEIRQVESLENYCKYFETRRKATRGACYRWHYVVGYASVSMFMFIGQRRHDNHTAAARVFCGPVAVDPPVLGACLPRLVCGLALNTTTATPTRTGLSRGPRPCAGDCVSVWFRSGGCWFCLSPSLLQHHHQARPASSLFWSCPLAH